MTKRREDGDGESGFTSPGEGPDPIRPDPWSDLVDDLWWAGVDHQATLHRLAQRTSRLLSTSSAVFILRAGQLVPHAFWDDDPDRLDKMRRLFDRGPAPADAGQLGQVLRERRPMLVTHAVELDRPTQYHGYISETQLTSYLILPLVAHDEVVGLLAVGRYADQPTIGADVQREAERTADVVAHIVRIAGLVERLRTADAAIGAMREAVVATDTVGRITFWNHGAERIYGRTAEEVLGEPVTTVLQPRVADIAEREHVISGALDDAGQWSGRAEQVRGDGQTVSVDVVVTRLYDEEGAQLGSVMVNRDVSAEVDITTQLERQQALAQAALDSSPMLTAVLDDDGVVLAASRGWAERIGPDDPIGSRIVDVTQRLLPDPRDQLHLTESFAAVVTGQMQRTEGDFDVSTDDGEGTYSIHLSHVPDVGAAITIADISDRVSRERALTYTAGHDSVTRLPNRTVFMDRAIHAMTRAARQRTQVGLLFCDLDAFKDLNDQYGHAIGDDVLEVFGDRLVQSCRSSDTVARIGGDEFVILLEDAVDEAVVAQVARRVVHGAAQPLQVPAATFTVTTSVGAVVVKPDPDTAAGEGDVEAALAQADAAMYEAKRRGKNRWVMFDQSVQERQDSRGAFLGKRPGGAEAGEFHLHFQPQYDAAGNLRGAEALVRWHHPERGLIEPFDVLHHNGTVPPAVGDWVLGKVAATLRSWLPALPDGFRLGVNLSTAQWLDRATADTLLDWLSRVDVPLERVRVELPQDAMVIDLDHSRAVARQLTDGGIDVAVNGFGTTTGSLPDLVGLHLGTAVLSRSVVRGVGRVAGADRLLRGVVALCHGLGWEVIATGVETSEQLAATRDAGALLMQGYLLGRPVPADQFGADHLDLRPPADRA